MVVTAVAVEVDRKDGLAAEIGVDLGVRGRAADRVVRAKADGNISGARKFASFA